MLLLLPARMQPHKYSLYHPARGERVPTIAGAAIGRLLKNCGFLAALGMTWAALSGCGQERARPTLFELVPPDVSGVTFANTLPEDTAFNILNYLYYYNGGGVAAGDVDGDGRPDLFFTSNLGENRLYVNKGNFRFEDVTARAHVGQPVGWKSGVTMADVNGDGWLDIYVSAVDYLGMHGRNVLYINDGIGRGTFTNRTSELGLDFGGYSTQATFFDYDGDGDLDMYLLNSSVHSERGVMSGPNRVTRNPRAGDRLYRNDGGHFVDVSEQAHIYGGVEGYGLGVVASDFNGDGCIDLFVANDFQENDFLYLNNCDGTFTESIETALRHTSRFSMGVDAADFNNDLRPDLVVVDMLPDREDVLKTSASTESYSLFSDRVRAGYFPQYERNTLHLNRGTRDAGRGTRNDTRASRPASRVPLFSDIGFLAGIAATDWSWAPLFADLDNDGRKDLFITNGIYRRPNDLDYIGFVGGREVQTSISRGVGTGPSTMSVLKQMPSVPLANYAFRNDGSLRFTNMADTWGLAKPGFSNGATYVDLDQDGALDLVVNNVNGTASIYRNHARRVNGNHYLAVQLQGEGGNTAGIGARVVIKAGGVSQMLEQMPTRGFQSSVDPRLHFGLGTATQIDSLIVTWPDRRVQVLTNVAADRPITLVQGDASPGTRDTTDETPFRDPRRASRVPLFKEVTSETHVDFKHRENSFADFAREPLLPRLLSTEGPALAVGDVNGDSLDDIYIGGARGQAGRLYLQLPNGTFRPTNQATFAADSLSEDVDAVFFDADRDGDQDLYVVSGGGEFSGEADALQDRLYLNDGKGGFHRDKTALPRVAESGSVAAPADFNGDGHVDLFVGRRMVAGKYGVSPRSYLLQNDGYGHFIDVTSARGDSTLGMVSSAAWVDYDADGKLDLIVAGEWMPIRVFHQEGSRFVERTAQVGLSGTNGWWSSVSAADVNADGRADLVLGNVGLNSYIRASAKEPARLYVYDFAHNGTVQQILTSYRNGVSYPLAGRDELVQAVPQLRDRYPTYASFGAKRVEDIFPQSELRRATVLEAATFATSVAINKANGGGTFELRPLPDQAQLAPVYASLVGDFDGDGRQDILQAGNLYGVTPMLGRYDAGYGLLLRGNGDGTFAAVDMEQSGVELGGQVRHMKPVRTARGRLIAVARNDDTVQLLRPTRQ